MCGEAMVATDGRWLGEFCLGHGLPGEAEHFLRLAGLSYRDDAVAEAYLQAAQGIAPQHIAVQIGFYRFYFYKGRLAEARAVALRCLDWAVSVLELGTDWRRVRAGDAAFDSFDAILPRFFLFTLKGYAYLQMRLGELEDGRRAAAQLCELDPADKLGGKRLLHVLERQGQDDDD